MMRLLILTKIHPIEVLDQMQRLWENFGGVANIVSPIYSAMDVAEKIQAPFTDLFYISLNIYNEQREWMMKELESKEQQMPLFVTVGTDVDSSRFWYDYVVGIDDGGIQTDYQFDESWNVNKLNYLTLKDADLVFKSFKELQIFMVNLIRRKEKENENE